MYTPDPSRLKQSKDGKPLCPHCRFFVPSTPDDTSGPAPGMICDYLFISAVRTACAQYMREPGADDE